MRRCFFVIFGRFGSIYCVYVCVCMCYLECVDDLTGATVVPNRGKMGPFGAFGGKFSHYLHILCQVLIFVFCNIIYKETYTFVVLRCLSDRGRYKMRRLGLGGESLH